MVHARVFGSLSSFQKYTNQRLDKKNGNPTTPIKLETGIKPSILYLHALFFTGIVRKDTAHDCTNTLNMCYHTQNYFCGIFVGIPHHKKVSFYVPQKRKIVSSYNVVFDEILLVRWLTRNNNMTQLFG